MILARVHLPVGMKENVDIKEKVAESMTRWIVLARVHLPSMKEQISESMTRRMVTHQCGLSSKVPLHYISCCFK